MAGPSFFAMAPMAAMRASGSFDVTASRMVFSFFSFVNQPISNAMDPGPGERNTRSNPNCGFCVFANFVTELKLPNLISVIKYFWNTRTFLSVQGIVVFSLFCMDMHNVESRA